MRSSLASCFKPALVLRPAGRQVGVLLNLVLSFCLFSSPALCRAAGEDGAVVAAGGIADVQPSPASETLVTADSAAETGGASDTAVVRVLPQPPDGPVPSRSQIRAAIDRHAALYRLDPLLLHAIVSVESAYDPHAVSSAGAVGLMQLMPETAVDYGVDSVARLFDVEINLRTGSRHLKRLIEKYDSIGKAVMAYNAGEGALERGEGVVEYPETQRYTYEVLSRYLRSKGVSLYSPGVETLLGMAMVPEMAAAGSRESGRIPVSFKPAAPSRAWPHDSPWIQPGQGQPTRRDTPTRLRSRLTSSDHSLLGSHLEELTKRRERFSNQARSRNQAQSSRTQTFGYPGLVR